MKHSFVMEREDMVFYFVGIMILCLGFVLGAYSLFPDSVKPMSLTYDEEGFNVVVSMNQENVLALYVDDEVVEWKVGWCDE